MEPSREAPGPSGLCTSMHAGPLRWRRRERFVPAQHRFRRIAVALLVWASAAAIFPADRYTGLQIGWTNDRQDRSRSNEFDPEGVPAPEIRCLVRLAQC